ncbi:MULTISPECIES: aminotransferase [Rhodomicrobium]|uniref:aminotransferase n=1 Tax=Rhodomicrobium TaxID=1068 RepID=UPI000B4B9522|nr:MULTISPECIES: aminotransferase [Rhodomicrobium]
MTVSANALARDIETLIHPYTNLAAFRETGPLILESGKGVYVYDTAGKPYIEGMAGLWCTSLGYGNQELIEAGHKQLSRLASGHLFGGKSHDPAIELAEKLKEISPAPASKIFFTSSGSEANDTQIKLAWYYNNARGLTQKKKIISRKRAYHGVTLASASLTGLPNNHLDFDLPFTWTRHLTAPYYYRDALPSETEEAFSQRLARELDSMIQLEGPDTVAAFIAEPVQGAGGVILPPAGYFAAIQQVLAKYDILFIVDEVICGFGRTGQMFGSQTYNLQPDTISMAKGLTSAYAPLGAITVSEDVYQAMLDESRKIGTFAHGFTYSGHPMSAAIGVKAVEIYQRDNIPAHVRAVAQIFQTRLKALRDHPLVGEVRGVGLLGGVELVADKETKRQFAPRQGVGAKLANFCEQEGLILRALGDTLAICPPLIIDGGEINALFDRLDRALERTEAFVHQEKLREVA